MPRIKSLAAILLLVSWLPGCDTRSEQPEATLSRSDAPRRIDVLFFGHADSADNARAFAPILAAAIGKHGINIHYTEDTLQLSAQKLALVDAVILFANLPRFSGPRQVELRRFVTEGAGLLSLADTIDRQSSDGLGRYVQSTAGRDSSTWQDSTTHRQIMDAILQAAGDKVRAQWQAYAVPPLQYEDPPVAIPNYENRPEAPRLQLPLSPEAAIKHWQVPPGFELKLFAAEPEIVNPIAMAWDERGRLWVVETVDYPNNIQPDGQGNDVIRILEDTNNDGRADKSTVFADKLSIPTGIVFAQGGIIVSNAPRFLFLKDTTRDDRADIRREILTGWSVADTHSGPSNLQYGFDNWIWGAVGDAGFNGTIGRKRMQFEDAIYRFKPDGSALEIVARFTNNTWALGFSEGFDVFTNTANNEHSVFVAIPNPFYEGVTGLRGSGKARLDGHYARHPIARTRQVDYFGGFTAAGGHQLYTARSFPREYWNSMAFVHEAIGGLVHNAILERSGSGFREQDGWNLIASADEWSAPVQAQVGPDGAVWILDWYSFIKQHNPTPPGFTTGAGAAYDTPLRDKQRGRIYRLVYRGAPAYEPMQLSVERPSELVAALRNNNLFWRLTAQRLLVERGNTDVAKQLYELIRDRHIDEEGLAPGAIHAIWTLHGLGMLNGSNRALVDALRHPSANVRKNALLALPRDARTFERMAPSNVLTDPDPNVRLHALLTLAEVPAAEDIGRRLFALGKERASLDDQWLPTALFLAARQHANGFLAAYGDELGAAQLASLTARAARGELESVVNWSGIDQPDADWDTVQVPAHWTTTKLAHFPGVVWFRTSFELPASAASRKATLHLGPISDVDVSYVNGVRVGSMDNVPGERRRYDVPAGVLRAGRNIVAVEVTNQRRGGGIYGTADSVFIAGDGFKVPLAGHWKYRKAAEWQGGRAPDFTPGIPFEQQFVRIYHARPRAAVDSVSAAPADVTLQLRTVPGQNRFDQTLLTVRAGQRVGIAFNNTDAAAHNVVVIQRGNQQQQVGSLLNAYVSDASAAGRDFIPPRLEVIAKTSMVSARQAETIVFTAPSEPGDYPFLCTVPGHWVTMWGILRVTR